jgi:hypothetical protein
MMKYSPEEIKKMLEGITQGEWETKENGGKGELVGITSPKSNWFIAEEVLKKDASFIAAAPTIIRDLLAEVERLQESGNEILRCNKLWEEKYHAAQALAATHLADQELLVGQERKRVARECAEIIEQHLKSIGKAKDPYELVAKMACVTIRDVIRTRYGVEEP